MNKTAIEWTDRTWNPLRARNRETGHVGHYCEKISPACAHCYAAAWNVAQRHKRHDGMPSTCGTGIDFLGKEFDAVDLFLDEQELQSPLQVKQPQKIFVCDMTDLFLDRYHFGWIKRVFDVMRAAHWHTFQVLTKRPQRMAEHAPHLDWPANVWAGTTVEDQPRAEERITWLLRVPATVRFLSLEPLLWPIRLTYPYLPVECPDCHDTGYLDETHDLHGNQTGEVDEDGNPCDECITCSESRGVIVGIDWVIVGGESGPGAQPMHPRWVRGIRDQCVAAGVPFFFKQWGEFAPLEDIGDPGRLPTHRINRNGCDLTGLHGLYDDSDAVMVRVGKKAAGRLLDGREWSEFPACAPASRS